MKQKPFEEYTHKGWEAIKDTIYAAAIFTTLLSPAVYMCNNPRERPPDMRPKLLEIRGPPVGSELGPMYLTHTVDGELILYASESDNFQKAQTTLEKVLEDKKGK